MFQSVQSYQIFMMRGKNRTDFSVKNQLGFLSRFRHLFFLFIGA